MREIIFRGKRKDNGEWVEGGIIPLDVQSGYVFIAEPFLSASTLPVHEIVKHHMHFVVPETVGQYTGLKDKNGTKIFEGDIVKTKEFGINNGNGINFSGYDIFEVIYSSASFKLNNTHRLFNMTNGQKFEVIGNIHDHPELLGGE